MSALGLLALIFVLAPGFIADTLFRSTRGLEKGREFERLLRSLVWSVFGIAVYQLLHGRPVPYLPALMGSARPFFGSPVLVPLAFQTVYSCGVALIASRIAENTLTKRLFQRVFRRPMAERGPWDVMWADFATGRKVRVERKDGVVYWGFVLAVSTGKGKKEILIREPSVATDNGRVLTPLVDVRLLYIGEDDIREIQLSKTGKEWND